MLYRCGVVIDIGASEPDPLPATTVGATMVGWKEGQAEVERLRGSWRRRWLRLRYQRCQGDSLAR